MDQLKIDDVKQYVNENIGEFHNQRVKSLDNLKLLKVIKNKNPYLFKAKNMMTSETIVKAIVDAHISSNEETIFGDWLEGLAIFINNRVYGGKKSGIPGIDLEFDNDDTRYIVSIKSGPNWGNRSQIDKLKADFISAKRTLRTGNSRLHIVAVNGCCYGRCANFDRGEYYKYCGQKFWSFISHNDDLYIEIIEPLGFNAKKKNEEYESLYSNKINLFTKEFTELFCNESGAIRWDKILVLNSSVSGAKITPPKG